MAVGKILIDFCVTVCAFWFTVFFFTGNPCLGCGYAVSNPNPAGGRIVGGSVVNPQNKLPYQVYVQVRLN